MTVEIASIILAHESGSLVSPKCRHRLCNINHAGQHSPVVVIEDDHFAHTLMSIDEFDFLFYHIVPVVTISESEMNSAHGEQIYGHLRVALQESGDSFTTTCVPQSELVDKAFFRKDTERLSYFREQFAVQILLHLLITIETT